MLLHILIAIESKTSQLGYHAGVLPRRLIAIADWSLQEGMIVGP